MKHGLFKSGMVLLAAGILLSGCVLFDGSRRSGPDEFGVVSRAPLSQPPDYSLRPPRAGAARPNVETPRDDAQKQLLSGSQPPTAKVSSAPGVPTIVAPALTGPAGASVKDRVPTGAPAAAKGVQAASGISQGELALLEQAGATQVDPKIRTLVDRGKRPGKGRRGACRQSGFRARHQKQRGYDQPERRDGAFEPKRRAGTIPGR